MRTLLIGLAIATSAIQACGNDDGGPIEQATECPVEANFQSIHDNLLSLNQRCASAGCHGQAMSGSLGLNLGAQAVLTELLSEDVANTLATQTKRVVPKDASNSFLYVKLSDPAAPFGRMPLGGPALLDCELDAVREWIDNGANP